MLLEPSWLPGDQQDSEGFLLEEPCWQPTNRQYHSITDRWSSSMLKLFREIPGLAYGQYVTQEFERKPASPAMVTGSATNAYLLEERGGLNEIHVITEAGSRTNNAYKRAVQTWPERLVLTSAEASLARRVARSILEPRTPAADLALALLRDAHGYAEWATQWEDSSGVPCKMVIGRAIQLGGKTILVELKTSIDPTPRAFRKTVYKYGYDRQAAFNLRGFRAATGQEALFYFVAVRNVPPFDVAVYELSEDAKLLARTAIDNELSRLAQCLADPTGALWTLPHERLEDDKIPLITAPRWAKG